MTESKWLACAEPGIMLRYLIRSKRHGVLATDRKLRLYLAACCRRIWSLIDNEPCRKGVVFAEQFADGLIGDVDRRVARSAAREAAQACQARQDYAAACAAWSASYCLDKRIKLAGGGVPPQAHAVSWARRGNQDTDIPKHLIIINNEMREQSNLLRDIIGSPFRPVTINPAWKTRSVGAIAQAAYEDRILPAGTLDNTRLAILADALEEAGCDNSDVLNHLRQPGDHVRGCWVVDLLLGKE